jgi:LEA14-like dessication related protein
MARNKIIRSKWWIWLVSCLLIIIGAVFLWQRSIILNYGKEGGKKPHLSIKEIKVHDIGENRISLTAKVMVSNPLLIKLNADRLQYQLFIDSTKIIQTDFVRSLSIEALDSMMLTIPMEVLRKNMVAVMNRFDRNETDSTDYTLRGKLFFRLPVAGEKTYVVNKTQRGPAFRMLQLEIRGHRHRKIWFQAHGCHHVFASRKPQSVSTYCKQRHL